MGTRLQSVVWWKKPAGNATASGPLVKLTIDGKPVEAPAGVSLLSAASAAGIYIPALCAHPDLPPSCQRGGGDSGCNLCVVEIAGTAGMRTSCAIAVEEGMAVTTKSPAIDKLRQERIAKTLGSHPHNCLTCPQREGCSRTTCSFGNPVEQRCCSIFHTCELRKVSDYIGIPATTPNYKHIQLPVIKDEPFYDRDYNLCIDCRRCLVACNEVRGVGCLEVKETEGRKWVGTIAPTLIESGCKFCSACVTVCPTGALMDRTLDVSRKEESQVPCKHTCPAGIDVPRYVQLVGLGKYSEAVAVVREKLPFPGILGRACFSPCESACRRKHLDEPVSIRSLKRIAADNDTGLWRQYSKQLPPTGKKAAIIGAGPAGLTAAYYLAKKGHSRHRLRRPARRRRHGALRHPLLPRAARRHRPGSRRSHQARRGDPLQHPRREDRRTVRAGLRGRLHRHRRPGRRQARPARRRPAQRGRQPDLPARRDARPDRHAGHRHRHRQARRRHRRRQRRHRQRPLRAPPRRRSGRHGVSPHARGNAGARRRGAGLRGGRREPALPAGAEEDRAERVRQLAPEDHLREDGTRRA
jgi:ferredoxin